MISPAPIVLAIGLVMGFQLTSRLVPMVWESMLPGGLNQARFFHGWAGLLWNMALRTHYDFPFTLTVLIGIGLIGFVLSAAAKPLRPLVWLMAAAVIGINAGIIYVTLRTAIEAIAAKAGM